MWRCPDCNAMVSDFADVCSQCKGARRDAGAPPAEQAEGAVGPERDAEGYTAAERARRRPLSEIADAHLLSAQRARRRAARRRGGRRSMFSDAVVPGSVRVSRPLFTPFKH